MFEEIYLTGFKAFAGVNKNPTQLIAKQFIENPHPKVKVATRLDVTVKDVDKYVQQMREQQKQSEKRILNLHLGVGPNKVYFLEKCCYNNKDFRIPDNSGYQCLNTKICEHKELDEAIYTKVDLEYIANKLGKKHDVELSTDPGRYLCNYVYFASLDGLCGNENVASLFIHFPDLKIKSHEENMKFINHFIKLVTEK